MDLSIVIVNYNQTDFLRNCISSIYEATTGLNFEVIVVDNNSFKKGTRSFLKEQQNKYSNFKYIINSENFGFSKANNIGYQNSSGDFLIFLNPDTILLNNVFKILYGFFSGNSLVGATVPRILSADGSFQVSFNDFPSLSKIFFRTLRINKFLLKRKSLLNFIKKFRKIIPKYAFLYNSNFEKIDKPLEVPWVTGACLAVKRDIFVKAGLFDVNYKLYCEDMDLCLRIRNLGYKNFFIPEAKIIHFDGWKNRSLDVINYHFKSYRYYYCKNYSGIYKGFLLFFNVIEWGCEKFLYFLKIKAKKQRFSIL